MSNHWISILLPLAEEDYFRERLFEAGYRTIRVREWKSKSKILVELHVPTNDKKVIEEARSMNYYYRSFYPYQTTD